MSWQKKHKTNTPKTCFSPQRVMLSFLIELYIAQELPHVNKY